MEMVWAGNPLQTACAWSWETFNSRQAKKKFTISKPYINHLVTFVGVGVVWPKKKSGEAGYRSLCLMHALDAKHALYHLSYIPNHIIHMMIPVPIDDDGDGEMMMMMMMMLMMMSLMIRTRGGKPWGGRGEGGGEGKIIPSGQEGR
jgi:hypothetical protein